MQPKNEDFENLKIYFMNKIILIFLFISIISCKNEKEKEVENIEKTLKTYLSAQLQEGENSAKIDSLKIIGIDSTSTKDELEMKLFRYQDSLNFLINEANYKSQQLKSEIEQYRILKYMNNLTASTDKLSVFKNSINEKKDEAEKSLNLAMNLKKEVDQFRKNFTENKIDSTNFIFYNIQYRLCYTNSKLEQKCKDSLSIIMTKDFKIKKK
jgi:hypothetical protein